MSSNTHGVADCIMNSWVLVELHGKADQRVWESRKRKDERSDSIQSTAGHVKSGGKPGGPPSKPKYYPMTDSEEYCEGKVKRTPGGEWKRTWNLMFTSTQSTFRCDVVLFVERSGELLYAARLSDSVTEPQGNRVWIARIVACNRPETGWPIHEQVEGGVKPTGGPNRPPLKSWRMTCG